MCCRLTCEPLLPEIAQSVLMIGQFKPLNDTANDTAWERQVAGEATTVRAVLSGNTLELSITPAISMAIHHAEKRLAAGIYFEIAARYAEKVGGTIRQRATVPGCTDAGKELLVASYPSQPMTFDRVCAGFRSAIMGELND